MSQVKVNTRGTGDAHSAVGQNALDAAGAVGLQLRHPPRRSPYGAEAGLFGSRRIQQSTYDNVAVRVLTADTHPDHDILLAAAA